MPAERIFTVEEFKRFCSERNFRCFCYNTRNQRADDTEMDLSLVFQPPMCAFNSDILCFRNASKDRMVLRNVRSVLYTEIMDTGIGEAVFRCAPSGGGNTIHTYLFTVS